MEDPRQKGKAGRSPACMAAIAAAAIFRGCRCFSGFASFAKADGAWLERRGVHCEACAGPAGERRPESIPASCRRRSAAFRGEGRAPPRRSRIRRERANGFLPPSCKRSASPGAGGAAKADTAGAFGSKTGAAPAQVLINEKNQ
ncbi:MAG: hypothetical protein LBU32_13100 [Clostridiales bacterium]|nr:hypothetical protein [Clostridiales bacterium]